MWRVVAYLSAFVLLLALIASFGCPKSSIAEAKENEGKCVIVCGYVVSCYLKGENAFYRVFDGDYIRAIEFDSGNCPSGYVCLRGRVENGRFIVLERA